MHDHDHLYTFTFVVGYIFFIRREFYFSVEVLATLIDFISEIFWSMVSFSATNAWM